MSAIRNRRAQVGAASKPALDRPRVVVDGVVHAVTPEGTVRVLTNVGGQLTCRIPMHISLGWLKAALEHGPITAELSLSASGGPSSLWALFPGPEHEGVVPATVEIAASERVDLRCGNSRVAISPKELRVKSRDVTIGGSRTTRIRGGTVKLN